MTQEEMYLNPDEVAILRKGGFEAENLAAKYLRQLRDCHDNKSRQDHKQLLRELMDTTDEGTAKVVAFHVTELAKARDQIDGLQMQVETLSRSLGSQATLIEQQSTTNRKQERWITQATRIFREFVGPGTRTIDELYILQEAAKRLLDPEKVI